MESLHKGSETVQCAAAQALAQVSLELRKEIVDILPALYAQLSGGSESVKRAAARAIGSIGYAWPNYASEALHRLGAALTFVEEDV